MKWHIIGHGKNLTTAYLIIAIPSQFHVNNVRKILKVNIKVAGTNRKKNAWQNCLDFSFTGDFW